MTMFAISPWIEKKAQMIGADKLTLKGRDNSALIGSLPARHFYESMTNHHSPIADTSGRLN